MDTSILAACKESSEGGINLRLAEERGRSHGDLPGRRRRTFQLRLNLIQSEQKVSH